LEQVGLGVHDSGCALRIKSASKVIRIGVPTQYEHCGDCDKIAGIRIAEYRNQGAGFFDREYDIQEEMIWRGDTIQTCITKRPCQWHFFN
jgi:hypothetical protein